MLRLLNIWQELFDAFSKGTTGFQYWGLVAGILIFMFLILKPILKYFNSTQSPRDTQVIFHELTRFLTKIELLKNNINAKSNALIKDFYNMQYEDINSLILFTNEDLNSDDVDKFLKVMINYKMTSGYIVCKQTEFDKSIFNSLIEKFDFNLPQNNYISKNAIHIKNVQDFKLNLFFSSKLKSDIVFNQIKVFN